MASVTIRDLDEDVRTRLRVRTAGRGRPMEDEAGRIPRNAVGRRPGSRNPVSVIHSHLEPDNGMDPELPAREPGRQPPSFD